MSKIRSRMQKPSFLLKGLLIFFVIAVSIGFVLFFFQTYRNKSTEVDKLPPVKIAPENLELPEDPLVLPPIQFSREQKKSWEKAEIEEFFVEPDESSIENLHEKNSEKIRNLLDGVE